MAWVWDPGPPAWLGRHGAGGPSRLAATITRKAPGRVWLRFERPTPPMTGRLWARMDIGAPGHPYPILVYVRPGGARPLTATLDGDDLVPDQLLPEGIALPLLDELPVERLCPGQVCLLRPPHWKASIPAE